MGEEYTALFHKLEINGKVYYQCTQQNNGSTYKLKYYTKNNNEYLKVKKEGSYEVKLSVSYDSEGNVIYTLVDND